jgi:hypothetical protein
VRGKLQTAKSGGGSCDGDELVALDFCGDADVAVGVGLDAHDLAAATDVNFGALRDLLRKSENEFDFSADFELRFGEEVKALIADVARLRAEFAGARLAGKHP